MHKDLKRNASVFFLAGTISAGLFLYTQTALAGVSGFSPTTEARLSNKTSPLQIATNTAPDNAVSGKMSEGAKGFVDSMANRGLGFLSNDSLSQDAKKTAFENLLKDSFDLDTIARFALGRYWNSASPQERTEYTKLFRKMVVDVYSNRFSEYKGEKFEVRSVRADSEKDALVTSFIVPLDGQEIQIDWRVRYKGGRYQIVDVIVEGVSMSVTQRSEFSSIIQRGGGQVAALIDHMKSSPNTDPKSH